MIGIAACRFLKASDLPLSSSIFLALPRFDGFQQILQHDPKEILEQNMMQNDAKNAHKPR